MTDFIKYKGFDHVWRHTGPWFWWLIGVYVSIPLTAYIILPFFFSNGRISRKRRTICIFVLGDLGHSPRMCYHAKSFSKLEYSVNLCGYLESHPPADITDDINVELYPIEVIRNTQQLPFMMFAIKKMVLQCFQIFQLLFEFRGAEYIMIQNPPSIPILFIVITFIKVFSRNTDLIIDWHNLNYTILNLRYNNLHHPAVRFLKAYERILGRVADLNFTVTDHMKRYLIDEFNILETRVITVHDRPNTAFKPLEELKIRKSDIFSRYSIFQGIEDVSNYKILVSATSFTPDEDFNLLLDALRTYDQSFSQTLLPPLLVIVTGKGPQKQEFLNSIELSKFSNNVIVRNAWLAAEDYPYVLSVADLSISLHTSSSGIDLPMKVVDFFGCGLPVISLDFPARSELIENGVNGLVVSSIDDEKLTTSQRIYTLLHKVFTNEELLKSLKLGAMDESKSRWDENWNRKLRKTFEYNC